ncbi:MAG: YceH family protein [Acidobacteriota bacterium]
MAVTRPLDAVEARVLGALMEKEQTTPDYYPMTIKAVIAAANQKSNRDPVMQLSETEVVEALDRLRDDVLAWRSEGARAERWEHRLDRRWRLDSAAKATMTLLLLRGPQTAGEIRTRSERMHIFNGVEEVERVLQGLAAREEPLVAQLERRPGQRETRWMHLAGDESVTAAAQEASAPATSTPAAAPVAAAPLKGAWEQRIDDLDDRLERLEDQVGKIAEMVENLRMELGID